MKQPKEYFDNFGKQFEGVTIKLEETNYAEVMLFSDDDALAYYDGNTNEKPGIQCPPSSNLLVKLFISTTDTGAADEVRIPLRRVGTGNVAIVGTAPTSTLATFALNQDDKSLRITSTTGFATVRGILVLSRTRSQPQYIS